MPDTQQSAAASGELRAEVTSYGTPAAEQPGFSPEEQAIADGIRAIDPLEIPGPQVGLEGRQLPAPTLETLSPAMRAQARERLFRLPQNERAGAEARVVMEVYREAVPDLRAATGLGASATPYHRELAHIAAEYRDYAREFDRIAHELTEVRAYSTVVDPATGEPKPVPVYLHEGGQRAGREDRLAELNYRMNLLQRENGQTGPEATRRLAEALRASVAAQLALKQAAEDKAEVERRVAAKIREDRIAEQVEVRARLQRGAH